MIQDSWVDHGLQATATWIPADEYDGEQPLVQAYALCLIDNLVCVIRSPETGTKLLPGGTIEEGEDPVETLHREVYEEANLDISSVDLLGVQRVEHSDTHPDYGEDMIYQGRYVADVDRADFLTEDPSEGFVFERCFVPLEDFADVIGWGDVAEELVRLAKEKASR